MTTTRVTRRMSGGLRRGQELLAAVVGFALVAAPMALWATPGAAAAVAGGHSRALAAPSRPSGRTGTAPTASIDLTGPSSAKVGDDILLRVNAAHLSGAAGFELSLRYAKGAFALGGDQVLATSLSSAGGPLVPVSTVERPDGVTIAAWSCTSPSCLAAASGKALGGSKLLVIDLVAQRAGRVVVALDHVSLVGPTGHRLPLHVGHASVGVAVATAAGRRVAIKVPAPRGVAALAARPRGHQATAIRTSDLTGDRRLDLQDVHEVELAWTAAVTRGAECTSSRHRQSADANRDGCLDVEDLQAYAHAAVVPSSLAGAVAHDGPAPIVLTVNSVGDQDDIATDGLCKTQVNTCTLRAAITESKRQSTNPVVINFAIPGSGPFVIQPQTRLPSLSNPMGVTIDGYTQPGAAANTAAHADNAVIKIQVVGQGVNGVDGFLVTSTNNVVRGLSIYEFHHDVWLYGSSAGNNRVVGDFIGTDPTGTHAAQFDQIGASGVNMQGGAYGNVVGGPALADRNVVSGNYQNGIATYDNTTTNNTIQDNIVGLTPAGNARLANRNHGIDINTWTTNTLIGGYGANEGNVSSGNLGEGIEISHGPGTLYNNIIGNLVGTDVTGTVAAAYAENRQWGVRLEGAQQCDPCGLDAGHATVANNVIVNNLQGGLLTDKGFHDSLITGNHIGVLADGTPAGNTLWGIRIAHGATLFTVSNNVIAYNDNGIQVDGLGVSPNDATSQPTQDNTITRNSIYSNADGLGIDLTPLGTVNRSTNADPTINDGLLAPTVTSISAGAVVGTTCAGCTVEAFEADRAAGSVGSGKRFISSTTADSTGHFVAGLDAAVQGKAVTVDVTDTSGSTSEFSMNVAVPVPRPNNVSPTAAFTSSCTHLSCTFNASGSNDTDGSVVNWVWDYGDGTTDQGSSAAHTYAHRGSYTVTLTVVDNDGGTGTVSHTANAVNASPTAVLGSSCIYLGCSFDGSGSSDADGTVASYAWSFGDGFTGTGSSASHTYPAAGTYTVGLVVTDNDGDTGTASTTVTVTAPPPGASATDTFTRTVASGGWKNADLGGAYTYPSGSSGLSVDGSTGVMTISSAGSTRSAYLTSVHDRDADLKISVGTDKTPTGFGQSSYLISRNVGTNVSYRSRLRFASNNGVYLTAMKVTGGSEVAIGAELQVAGLTFAPGNRYNFRTSVTGAGPTTLKLKVWPVGGSEPDWQLTRTDSEPVLQAAGSDAVMSYLSPSATNAPTTFRYDDLFFGANNVPPTAVGTFSCTNKSCSYDASGSSDPEGPVTSYQWDFGDGSTSSTASGSHRYADLSERDVVLTVTDNKGATGTWTTHVVLSNAAPVAVAALSCTNLDCTASAAGSNDPDGSIVSYAWDWGDGATSTGASASHHYAGSGEVTVALTVTDDDGATATATQSTTVTAANVPPTASFTASCTNLTCSFDGGASNDPDGTIVSYAWDFGDGATSSQAVDTHTYAGPGDPTVTLTVTDDRAGSGTATQVVHPRNANVTPTASFTVTCTAMSCVLDAGASNDSDGSIASYAWDFGDGTQGSGVKPTHVYTVAGVYPVTLTVTDDRGGTGTSSGSAHPVPPANPSSALATDAFARTVSNGWGTADLGGAWLPSSTPNQFSVAAGKAKLALTSAGTGRAGLLPARTFSDTDSRVTVSFDVAATGSGDYASIVGRHSGTNQEYRGRLRVSGTKAYLTPIVLNSSSTETPLAAEVQLPGITYSAGTAITLRMQVVGGSPTTVRLKAWLASAAEPAGWNFTLTDSTAVVQAAGSVGLHSQLSSSVTNAPVTTSFSGYSVVTSNRPPVAAVTVSCTGLSCTADASGSTDPDGNLSSYALSFGDGATSTASVAGHTYAAAGTYTVGVTVTDAAGLRSYAEQSVDVTTGG